MNNEIKEILDRLKYCKEHDEEDNYYPEDIFFKDDPYILLDYITNLQERIDKAIEYIEWQKDNPQYDNIWRKYECDSLINILQGEDNE